MVALSVTELSDVTIRHNSVALLLGCVTWSRYLSQNLVTLSYVTLGCIRQTGICMDRDIIPLRVWGEHNLFDLYVK
jgi:hypothetical protein